jgi:hypothetical protein
MDLRCVDISATVEGAWFAAPHGGEWKIKLVGGKEMEQGRTTGILIHLARGFLKQTKAILFPNN